MIIVDIAGGDVYLMRPQRRIVAHVLGARTWASALRVAALKARAREVWRAAWGTVYVL